VYSICVANLHLSSFDLYLIIDGLPLVLSGPRMRRFVNASSGIAGGRWTQLDSSERTHAQIDDMSIINVISSIVERLIS
jgi:hypothetical protein